MLRKKCEIKITEFKKKINIMGRANATDRRQVRDKRKTKKNIKEAKANAKSKQQE